MARLLGVSRALGAALSLGFVAGCLDLSSPPPLPGSIDAVKAYYCAQPGLATCQSRGAAIPAGTLPPSNEAFQVWAFYKGWVTTNWRLLYGQDSIITEKLASDSSYVWLNFNGAQAPAYTIHVAIRGATGVVARDSLRWVFTP